MKKFLSFSFVLLFALAVLPGFAKAETALDDYQTGLSLYQGKQYDQALLSFQKAVQLDPNQWQSYSVMGHSLVKLGRVSEALDAYSKSLALHPDATLQAYYDNLKSQQPAAPPVPASNAPAPEMNAPAAASPATTAPTPEATVMAPMMNTTAPSASSPQFSMSYSKRKQWGRLYGGLLYATLGSDLQTDASSGYNTAVSGLFGPGTAKNDNIGFYVSGEYGYLLDPYNGISLSVDYLQVGGFSGQANDGAGDTDVQTIKPLVFPVQANYYRFFPMGKSRFFVTGGGGFYYGIANYSDQVIISGFGSETTSGNLNGTGWGGTLGIGWETLITDQGSLGIYARGRYATLTHFQGNYSGGSGTAGLAVDETTGYVTAVDADSITSANNYRWATIDMTGFDIGASFAYHF